MAAIALEHIRVVFPGDRVALPDLTLAVAEGERLALVGASGSGKSTVLRTIAGLEQPSSGRVVVGDRDVTNLPPEQRDVAMVFQSYALYPHMSVRANLGFGLRMRGLGVEDIRRRVEATADSLGIAALLDRLPAQLSGGERQRVALGRAIVRQPHAFLFDEPLSNLDPRLRGDVRAELVRLHERLRATMIYVTHDQEEAMTLGQRIAVLRHGQIEQVGTPEDVYARPRNTFVATFIGSPPMNLIDGRVSVEGAGARVDLETGGRVEWPDSAVRPAAGATVRVGIRPHDLTLVDPNGGLRGRVDVVEPLGHACIVHVTVGETLRLSAVVANDARPSMGSLVGVSVRRDRLHIFDEQGTRLGDV